MDNLILIGMPGSGKSTVGVLCAKALGMPFVDTDLLLQQQCGQLLQNMVNTLGTEGFLRLEEQCVCALNVAGSVIATGGSVALREGAMRHLKKSGKVVFLRLSYEEVERRIKNIATRGIAMEKGETLRSLYDYRMPFYLRHADFIIDADGQTLERTVESVVRLFR